MTRGHSELDRPTAKKSDTTDSAGKDDPATRQCGDAVPPAVAEAGLLALHHPEPALHLVPVPRIDPRAV